jgi:hypothetical protein
MHERGESLPLRLFEPREGAEAHSLTRNAVALR